MTSRHHNMLYQFTALSQHTGSNSNG